MYKNIHLACGKVAAFGSLFVNTFFFTIFIFVFSLQSGTNVQRSPLHVNENSNATFDIYSDLDMLDNLPEVSVLHLNIIII